MQTRNFCGKCGVRLTRKGWRARLGSGLCDDCGRGTRRINFPAPLSLVVVIGVAAFAAGRYLRPPPPPLTVQRAANSPLSDLPINYGARSNKPQTSQDNPGSAPQQDLLYICGARTKKGTPCKRRVHFPGERCYQHKGMPAILPLDKLVPKAK